MRKTLIVFILMCLVYGCAPVGYYQSQGKPLKVSDGYSFRDIPVPAKFKFLPKESFVYESEKVRISTLSYIGKSWPHDVVEFYKVHMPKHDWRTLNILEGRDTTLSFVKDKEICIVKYVLDGRKGKLVLSISPLVSKGYIPYPDADDSEYDESEFEDSEFDDFKG